MLEAGGSDVTVATEIQRKKFAKTIWNVAFSSFATIAGSSPAAMLQTALKEGQSYRPYIAPHMASTVLTESVNSDHHPRIFLYKTSATTHEGH